MANYCWVYGVIHFTLRAGSLPVHRDQLRAQRSVTSMGKLYLFYSALTKPPGINQATGYATQHDSVPVPS